MTFIEGDLKPPEQTAMRIAIYYRSLGQSWPVAISLALIEQDDLQNPNGSNSSKLGHSSLLESIKAAELLVQGQDVGNSLLGISGLQEDPSLTKRLRRATADPTGVKILQRSLSYLARKFKETMHPALHNSIVNAQYGVDEEIFSAEEYEHSPFDRYIKGALRAFRDYCDFYPKLAENFSELDQEINETRRPN